MSELINNSNGKKEKLKKLILRLHEGESEQEVRQELIKTLSQIPYGDVVEVEQELISEGLPVEEVLKLCDVHAAVLDGNIDLSASAQIPEGHPIDVMIKENTELKKVANQAKEILDLIFSKKADHLASETLKLRGLFNALYDVDGQHTKSPPHKQHIWFLPTLKANAKKPKELALSKPTTRQ